MVCHARRARVFRRHRPQRQRQAPLPPLAKLDLSKPGERQAHDFLCRATNQRDGMWMLISLHRQGDVLLCVVRWVHPVDRGRPYSLAEVGLKEMAVYWRYYATVAAVSEELERRCAVLPS